MLSFRIYLKLDINIILWTVISKLLSFKPEIKG